MIQKEVIKDKPLFRFFFNGLREVHARSFRLAIKEINKGFPGAKKMAVVDLNITEIK